MYPAILKRRKPVRSWCFVWPFVILSALGCQPTPSADMASYQESDTERVMRLWARSCALCHVDGNGGAPVMGDVAAWQPRLARGEAMLLRNTLEGLGNMPPLGYCMSCERDDFLAMIRMMSGSPEAETAQARSVQTQSQAMQADKEPGP